MKTLIAMSLALLLVLAAGWLSQTTVTEQLSQTCSSESNYRNSWRDVYFIGDWLPNRDTGKSFVACVGPSSYLRYHPVDLALLCAAGGVLAGFIGFGAGSSRKAISNKQLKKPAGSA